MKFFAVLALAAVAFASPLPPKAGTSSVSAAPSGASQGCFNGACGGGGGYGWKREEEDMEKRLPPKATTTASAAPSGASGSCFNDACGGGNGYGWKRDDEVEERDVEVEMEKRLPPKATKSAAPAASSGAAQECFNGACGGGNGYGW